MSMSELELADEAFEQARQDEIGYSDNEAGPFLAYVKNNYHRPTPDDYREAYGAFEDAYAGEWSSLGEFAENQAELFLELDNLPGWITSHIDWENVWECELRHEFFAVSVDGDGLAPFWVYRND